MAKSTCRFTQDDIMATKAFKELPRMMQNITRNKRNIMAIENGLQVAQHIGFDAWEEQTQSCHANKMIIKELLQSCEFQFPWQSNRDQDDFTCILGDFLLRVEAMDEENWWWQLSFKDKEIDGTWFREKPDNWPKTKDRAIGLCEGAYLGFSKNNMKIK